MKICEWLCEWFRYFCEWFLLVVFHVLRGLFPVAWPGLPWVYRGSFYPVNPVYRSETKHGKKTINRCNYVTRRRKAKSFGAQWFIKLEAQGAYVTLRYVTLRYVTWRYVTLRYVMLRYVNYVILRNVTLRIVRFRTLWLYMFPICHILIVVAVIISIESIVDACHFLGSNAICLV